MNGNGSAVAVVRRLPEVAQFYCAVSAVLTALLLATGMRAFVHRGGGAPVDLNPRAPVFAAL